MKFTLEWLLSHLETQLSVEEISEKLTSIGLEVEEIIDSSKKFEKFVLGYVVTREKHPDADKLSLCEVDVGQENPLQIVCGAHNVKSGMKVAVALVNAIIPESGLPLKKGKIRGVESQGMLCSARELMIDMDDGGGIIDLSENTAKVGTPLAQALDSMDIILDIGITPNRSDCFSVRGIAKFLAAAGAGNLKPLMIDEVQETIEDRIDVQMQTSDCPYFSCRAVRDVDANVSTPSFIKKRLSSIGQKLIFAPVDIANYICLDIGQPMHIFDLDKIESLVVRNSSGLEILDTLNGDETTIPENSIVVASKKEALSIAGIMGGKSTSFCGTTKNILIESAYFDKVSIALTGQKLRINSASRTRNERGIDPQMVDFAMNYVSHLLSQSCNCKFGRTMRYGKPPENRKTITLSFEKFKDLTGFSEKEWNMAENLLKKLDIEVLEKDQAKMDVLTPSFRHDLNIEEDIIEEILILIGYENVEPLDLPKVEPKIFTYNDEIISELLTNNGYSEVKTFSFVDEKNCLMFSKEENLIKLREPLTNEFAVMRPSVVCSLLKCFKSNQNKNQPDCSFFEIGKKFSQKDHKIIEESMLTIMITGKNHERSWIESNRDVSIYDIRGTMERILASLDINNYKITAAREPNYYHPGRSGIYTFKKNETLAFFGEIHPSILNSLDIDGKVVVAELFLDIVPKFHNFRAKTPIVLSPFQPIIRDFSFVVERSVTSEMIFSSIKKASISSSHDINIFDVYNLDKNKKAIGVEITLYPQKETLSDKQITDISNEIILSIQKNCKGELRI